MAELRVARMLVVFLFFLSIGVAALAAQPVITGVTIPNTSMKIGDVVTATISVQSDSATYTLGAGSDIGDYGLGSLTKVDSITYTAQFTITEGGTDYAASDDIPTNVTLADGSLTDTWNTPISQDSDPIDANRPTKPAAPDLADASDNGASNSDDITNDNTSTFQGGAGSAEGSSTVTVTSSIDGQLGTTVANSDGSWSFTSPALSDGTHSITVTATDAAGNESVSSDALTVLIDTQPPDAPGGRNPADGTYTNDASPTLSWAVPNDSGGSGIYEYRVEIDGPVTRDHYTTSKSYTPSLGTEGTYTWRLYAIDIAGNDSAWTTNWTFTIDVTDPVISNVLITDTTMGITEYVKDGDDVTITATVTDTNLLDGDTAYITGDLAGFSGGAAVHPDTYDGTTATWTLSNVTCNPSDGTVTVTVDAQDRAGNAATQGSDTITSDNTNPVIANVLITNDSIVTNDYVKDTDDVTITATVTDTNLLGGDTAYITGDLTGLGSGAAVHPDTYDGTTATWTLSNVTCNPSDGTVTVTIDAQDRAGNAATQRSDTITSDNTSPVIANVLITNDSIVTNDYVKDTDDVTITATVTDTNLLGGDTAYITGDLTGLGSGAAVHPDSYDGTTATWTLSNVTCNPSDGTVTVTVDAQDRAGNAATQGSDTITSDNTDPEITNVLITNTTVSTTMCIKDTDDVTITARVTDTNLVSGDTTYITADMSGLGSGAAVHPDSYDGTTATWTLSNVTCNPSDGTVTVTVDAQDRAGNAATQGSDTITSDNTAPTIDSITSTTIDGCYGAGKEINVTIHFSEDVTLSGGNLTVNLDSGGKVTIEPFGPRAWASGTYTVVAGHNSCDLDVTSLVLAAGATLRDCPWNDADLSLPVDNLAGNKDLTVDTTPPVISGVDVQGAGIWFSNEDVSADCCVVTLDFRAHITDNCSVPYGNVNVTWALGVGSPTAVVDNLVWRRQAGQTDIDVVDIIGTIDVRCVTGCPTTVVLTVTANDCAGNIATPLVSDSGTMGRVYDVTPPIAKDDPSGEDDTSAVLEPGMDVRRDDYGHYRLMVRQDTPVRIDVLGNDTDNCSACTCCATLWINDIVEQPQYGTLKIETDHGDCNGGTVIRYAPDRGYVGPDQFKYRIVDACGNVSNPATVSLEVVAQTKMEDVYATTCAGDPVDFSLSATDLWIDPNNPGEVPFIFSMTSAPLHGIILGDRSDVTYSEHGRTTKQIESAETSLTYVPASGFTGRDRLGVRFADPFGGASDAVVDIMTSQCAEAPARVIRLHQGDALPILVPYTFAAAYEAGEIEWSVEGPDGSAHSVAISASRDTTTGTYILSLDTTELPPGEYKVTIPLGSGEQAVFTVEVSE